MSEKVVEKLRPLKFALLTLIPVVALSAVGASEVYVPCTQDKVKYTKRAKELQLIRDADQTDRPNNQLRPGALSRDRLRRQRVGEIYGEGCFKEIADYAAAAMVFQHGDQPDHFLQTFLWSKRAVELGDPKQKNLMALGIDRYLTNIGQKQLFASQATKSFNAPCWCLEQVETTFPEETRVQYTGKTIKQTLDWVTSMNAGTTCPPAKQCEKELRQSPKGTVPGFW